MVYEQFRIGTEELIKKILIVIFSGAAQRTAGDIYYGVQAGGFQLPCVPMDDPSEVRERSVRLQQLSIRHFVQFHNADAIFVSLYMLCHDVHCDLGKIEVDIDAAVVVMPVV